MDLLDDNTEAQNFHKRMQFRKLLNLLICQELILFDSMEDHNCPLYVSQESSSDSFFQNILQQSQSDHERYQQETPQDASDIMDDSESFDFEDVNEEKKDLRQMLDMNDLYLSIPQNLDGGEELFAEKLKQNSFESETMKLNQPQNIINRCPYWAESKKIKIQRYRQKKSLRKWNKKVSYDSRKIIANKRQRISGRFTKGPSPVKFIDIANFIQSNEGEICSQVYPQNRFVQNKISGTK